MAIRLHKGDVPITHHPECISNLFKHGMLDTTSANLHQVKTKDWWKILIAKLRGHFQYYGVSENYNGIVRFYKFTIKMVRKGMNRRSQKRKMSWDRFTKYFEHYPLPKPKIVHSFYVSPVR